MQISIFSGLVFMMAIGFLLCCYRGFACASDAIRARRKARNVFPLEQRRESHGRCRQSLFVLGLLMVPATAMHAQNSSASQVPAANPVPAPPSTPAMIGPLSMGSPATFDAGPLGKLDVTGVLSGFGVWQNNPPASDDGGSADISNAQIFIQKTHGFAQYFLQAGAYNIAAIGVPFISTGHTVGNLFGAIPVGYLTLVPKGNFSLEIGKLSTLMGNENTFSFQNMNIERGLLWNQTNDISRGIQASYKSGRLSGSFSWNDGYYSNRYNWITGALTYAINPQNSLIFTGGGNLGRTGYATVATPLYLNNSRLYDFVYTNTTMCWILSSYFQFNYVPRNLGIGVPHTTWTYGGALLASYSLTPHVFLVGRAEFIAGTGSPADGSVNLLYGPGSRAWAITLTPTYQKGIFFARPEFSFVQTFDNSVGEAFGPRGRNSTQARGMIEAGFTF